MSFWSLAGSRINPYGGPLNAQARAWIAANSSARSAAGYSRPGRAANSGGVRFRRKGRSTIRQNRGSSKRSGNGRRKFRRRVFKRRSKMSMKAKSASLQDAIAQPDYFDIERGDFVLLPPSASATGLPCAYFTQDTSLYNVTPGSLYGTPLGHNDPTIMQTIAAGITTATNPSIKFSVKEFSCSHMISNSSTGQAKITGYFCKARRDIPNVGNVQILDILGSGFLNSGIGAGGTHSNTGLTSDVYSPYQSSDFVLKYKICRVKSVVLQPGQSTSAFAFSHKRPFMVHPNEFVYCSSGQNYSAGTQLLFMQRGEGFWLFKLTAGQLFGTASQSQIAVSGTTTSGIAVRMVTRLKWTYKYIQDFNTVTTTTISNIATGATSGDIINPLTGGTSNSGIVQ